MRTDTSALARRLSSGALGMFVLLMAGCASTSAPVIYPPQGKAADAASAARVAKDAADCRRNAAAIVGLNGRNAPQLARDGGKVAATGFVATAVGAAVAGYRDVWQRARVVAAAGVAGATVKTLLEWNEPDDVHEEFVERCMKQRGHDVLGWR